MAGPTPVAQYNAKTSSPTTGAITTTSFTPVNGEILIVKAETWDHTISMSTPTGGGLTYTSQVSYGPTGFRPWVGIWTATVSGSPSGMTVSSTPSASAQCSIEVERWSGAQLDATPVTATANAGSGAANGSLTTTAANSVISWVASDSQSLDPATRAYLSSATDENVRDGHVGANGVGYHAYQAVAAAGATSFGLSAPTGMQYAIAGIEIKEAAGSTPIAEADAGSSAEAVAVSVTAPLAQGGSSAEAVAVAATVPLSEAGAGAQSITVSATVPLAEAGAGAQSIAVAATVPLADAGSAADSLATAISIAPGDAASAAQSIAVSVTAPLGEGGAAAEALSVVVTLALADAGAAADAIAAGHSSGLIGNAHGPLPIAVGAVAVHTVSIAGSIK
jgi:hypothetical protein